MATTIIGFGGTYYTLWSVESETVYYTSPSGRHYPSYTKSRFTYHKNISKDIETVRSMYPGITIDKGLRGKRSFIIENKKEDLSPEIIKYGKYDGRDVREIVKEDMPYVLHEIDNAYRFNPRLWDIAMETPEYKQHLNEEKKKLAEKCASFKPLESGRHKITMPHNPDGEERCVPIPVAEDHTLELRFKEVRECYYNGHTYYLPVLSNGKARRLKNKEFEFDLEIVATDINTEHGYCYQVANVLN